MNAGGTAIATPTTLAGALQLRDWTLDGVGNWASNDAQSVGDSLLTANRQHTNFNEINNVGGDVPSAIFNHDDTGNQISNSEFDFQWDALNRLRSVTRILDGALIASYSYDCQNRRMRKTVSNSGSLDGTTDYYYAGWRVCEEYTLTGSTETLKTQYVWGATYHDELISRDDRGTATVAQLSDGTGSDRQFQHHNTLFSVFAVTDETGNVLERYQYDPYGNQTVMDASFNVLTDSAIEQEFSYTGQRFDAEIDLYYYKNRFYSSEQGRFISRDPVGYEADDPNLYAYIFSSPINKVDPLGLFAWGKFCKDFITKCVPKTNVWITEGKCTLWFELGADCNKKKCPGKESQKTCWYKCWNWVHPYNETNKFTYKVEKFNTSQNVPCDTPCEKSYSWYLE